MLKRLLLAAMLMLAACQSAAPPETSTETPATFTSDTGQDSQWLETEMNGVSLGMWQPVGWETDLSDGLVLAEHTVSTDGMIDGGMLVYVFVPPVDEFDLSPDDPNIAWSVLQQVVKMPSHTGNDVAVSVPRGFDWEQYGGAYYMLSSGDGIKALVLALTISRNPPKVVVCNISIPASQVSRIRPMLPTLLDGLTLNGQVLRAESFAVLPDPLPFPRYQIASSSSENRVADGGSP